MGTYACVWPRDSREFAPLLVCVTSALFQLSSGLVFAPARPAPSRSQRSVLNAFTHRGAERPAPPCNSGRSVASEREGLMHALSVE